MARAAIAAAAYALACLAATAVASQDLVPPPTNPVEAVPPAVPPPPPPPLSVADGKAIEQAYQAAPEFPFPAALEGAVAALASPNPNVRAAAGAALANAAIDLARQEHGELDNPAAIDPNWAVKADYDPAADFAAARDAGRIGAWAQGLARHDPAYLALLPVRRRYEIIRARGGWSELPPGLKLGPGARGKGVPRLRARLAAEGYGAADLASPVYDQTLADEVADFQRRHGLTATGSLTAATIQAMNVTVDSRLVTINANLERERWLPDPMPPDRIVADIAGADVVLYENDEPTLFMRAIVGEPTKPTPMFASHVSSIEFNPAWHVPADIAKAELWPKEARSPDYFSRHGFAVVNGQLVQHAGPQSSLGRIKFEMPNPFSVYLHDTPGRSLFSVDSRGRSHGCVRLEKPNDLAVALLSGQGWTLDKVNAVVAQGDTRWVRPAKSIPVFLVYRTAGATDGGPAIFRPDLYGWDVKVNAALASATAQ